MPGKFSEGLGGLLKFRPIDNLVPQGPGRFIMECHRGADDLRDFLRQGLGNMNVNYNSLARGTVAGDHWHDLKREVITILEGQAVIIVQDLACLDFFYRAINSGTKFNLVEGYAHAIYPLTDLKILEIYAPKFDGIMTMRDTHRLPPERSLVGLIPREMIVS